MIRTLRTRALVLVLGAVLIGCPSKPKPDPSATLDAAATYAAPVASGSGLGLSLTPPPPDPAHGKELVLTYQCNRCHDGTGHPAAEQKKHCVHCHKDIMEGRFEAGSASIARWKPRVKELADAPSLEATNKRMSRASVERYLLQPYDLRPNLHQYMPRLAISPSDARDIAAYLVPDLDPPTTLGHPAETAGADLGKGRQLLETKGCGTCHVFTGVAAVPVSTPPAMDGKDLERGRKLAPDLRFVRDRMSAAKAIAWLEDPKAIKPDSPMPKVGLSHAEARDLAGYLLDVEITTPPPRPKVARLPLLTRKVTFKEVDEKVFHRTCWHCHSEPDYAIGDGGPGNSGGFGFKPRGLNLSDYNGIAAGFLDDKNERSSIFALDAEKVPRVVRALLARHDEEDGAETGPVRGMPLGYDPLPPEDIQLVESWVAQGRPR
jgi:mono/diheme cytochrome c family protein